MEWSQRHSEIPVRSRKCLICLCFMPLMRVVQNMARENIQSGPQQYYYTFDNTVLHQCLLSQSHHRIIAVVENINSPNRYFGSLFIIFTYLVNQITRNVFNK